MKCRLLVLFLFSVFENVYPLKIFPSSLTTNTSLSLPPLSLLSLRFNLKDGNWSWFQFKKFVEYEKIVMDPELEEAILLERLLITGCQLLQKTIHSGGHLFTIIGDVIGRTNSWPLRKLGSLLIEYSSKLNATASTLSNSILSDPSPSIRAIASKVISGFSHFLLFLAEWIQFASSRISLSLANSIWQLENIPKSLQRTVLFLLQSRGPSSTLPSRISELRDISSARFNLNLTNISLLINQSRAYRGRSGVLRRPLFLTPMKKRSPSKYAHYIHPPFLATSHSASITPRNISPPLLLLGSNHVVFHSSSNLLIPSLHVSTSVDLIPSNLTRLGTTSPSPPPRSHFPSYPRSSRRVNIPWRKRCLSLPSIPSIFESNLTVSSSEPHETIGFTPQPYELSSLFYNILDYSSLPIIFSFLLLFFTSSYFFHRTIFSKFSFHFTFLLNLFVILPILLLSLFFLYSYFFLHFNHLSIARSISAYHFNPQNQHFSEIPTNGDGVEWMNTFLKAIWTGNQTQETFPSGGYGAYVSRFMIETFNAENILQGSLFHPLLF